MAWNANDHCHSNHAVIAEKEPLGDRRKGAAHSSRKESEKYLGL
jgi:hypothetical protein